MKKETIYATANKKEGNKIVESKLGTRDIEVYELTDKVTPDMIRLANKALVVEEQNSVRTALERKLGWVESKTSIVKPRGEALKV